MRPNEQERTLVLYLLGLLPDRERLRLEERLLDDGDLDELLLATTDDLILAYLEGTLTGEEKARFETEFLASPDHRERMGFVRQLSAAAREDTPGSGGRFPGAGRHPDDAQLAAHGRPVAARPVAVAAGIAAAVAATVWLLRPAPPVTEGPPSGTAAGEPAGAGARVALNDASGSITRTSDGRWTGWPPQPGAVEEEVRRVLESQALEIPADVLELRGTRSNLRGASTGPATLALLDPVGVVVEEDRPVLRWRSVPGAHRYVVTLSDARGGRLFSSPPLTTTEWTPPPLPRGQSYSWQVIADTPSGTTAAPQPPEPEARFRVLDLASLQSLDEARRVPSHLVLGILYARAGLVADAERELRALATLNPDASLPEVLLADLRRQGTQKGAPTTEKPAQ